MHQGVGSCRVCIFLVAGADKGNKSQSRENRKQFNSNQGFRVKSGPVTGRGMTEEIQPGGLEIRGWRAMCSGIDRSSHEENRGIGGQAKGWTIGGMDDGVRSNILLTLKAGRGGLAGNVDF